MPEGTKKKEQKPLMIADDCRLRLYRARDRRGASMRIEIELDSDAALALAEQIVRLTR